MGGLLALAVVLAAFGVVLGGLVTQVQVERPAPMPSPDDRLI